MKYEQKRIIYNTPNGKVSVAIYTKDGMIYFECLAKAIFDSIMV